MKGWQGVVGAAGFLYIAAVLQQSLSPAISFGPVRPDFFLIVMLPMALFCNSTGAIWCGFFAGLLHGGLAGANLTHYVLSRVCAGAAIANVRQLGLQVSLPIAGLMVAGGTVVAQILLLFLAPRGAILPYLGATIGTAFYNGVLGTLVFALLKKLYSPKAV